VSIARFAFVIAACAVAVPQRVFAQDPLPAGVLSISVRDSLGRSIAGAELTVDGTPVRGVTDERGELRFNAVRGGPATLRIRRLGFRPTSLDVMVDQRVPVTTVVTLSPIAQRLAPIIVKGSNAYTGRMAGFYQRRDLGIGHFVSREKLEHDNPGQLTDVFRRLPGVQITSTRFIRNAIRFRGNGGSCWPLVWLDGAPLPTAEFDLDFLAPSSIEGIEVYSGISQVPPQFMGARGMGSCGVIVVWSREGERREKKRKKPVTATELADMVASLKVYTPDQVDVPARSDSLSRPQPLYPETLLFTGVPGQVLAEFVVDTLGHVELDTFGVISSTNPKFTQAVQRALPDWAYAPAMLNGKRVRQLVQQPFNFVVDSALMRRANRQ
jgi:TonB-dependent receptor-like protein/carboxypeptidase family protein/TonB-like protein